MELIQFVAVNKEGLGAGIEGSGGVIAIKTRTKPLIYNNGDANSMVRLKVNGYAAPVRYYEPKYIMQPGTANYNKYAAIFWEPDLVTDAKKTISFKCYVPNEIKTLNVRIEGISIEGNTYLHNQKITIPGRN
jgi:hypothetical protein